MKISDPKRYMNHVILWDLILNTVLLCILCISVIISIRSGSRPGQQNSFIWNGMPVLFYLLGMVMLIAMIPGFTTFLFLLSSRTKSAKIAKTSIGAFTAVVAVYLIRAITAGYFFFRLAARVTNIDSVRDAKVGDMILIRKDLFIYLLVNMVAIFVAKVYVSSILWFV